MPTSEKKYISTIKNLIECIEEAHDTHIFAEGDKHPKNCGYCKAVKDARKVLAEDTETSYVKAKSKYLKARRTRKEILINKIKTLVGGRALRLNYSIATEEEDDNCPCITVIHSDLFVSTEFEHKENDDDEVKDFDMEIIEAIYKALQSGKFIVEKEEEEED